MPRLRAIQVSECRAIERPHDNNAPFKNKSQSNQPLNKLSKHINRLLSLLNLIAPDDCLWAWIQVLVGPSE